jgi:hypothetical protein
MHNSGHEAQEHFEHPDQYAIDDWFLYGPQNQEIEVLVRKLTIGHGLRLSSVEGIMVAALKQKLHEIT